MTARGATPSDDCSTLDVARQLGMAVRSVQLMVDRGELAAWKTPGGHRRISRASVNEWIARHHPGMVAAGVDAPAGSAAAAGEGVQALLIEDSRHYQNLIGLVVKQHFPQMRLDVADDGISGLALAGRLQPRVLIVDILLPGIDGPTLIAALRSNPHFKGTQLVVVTSMDDAELEPYRFALQGLPLVHKAQLVAELPARLAECLAAAGLPAAT